MSVIARLIVVVVALAVVLGALFGLRFYQMKQQEASMSQAPPPVAVEVVEVVEQRWQGSLGAIGSVRAVNGVRVSNEIAGVVEAIEFESGQQVEAGQVLLRLDAETDEAALETRQADARLAQQQFRRFSDLIGQNAVSQSDFDEAQASFEAAEARVHEQQALLDKKVIRAPFSGVLGLRQVDLGQYIGVGTPIVEVNMLDPIQVDYTISERELTRVEVGDPVEIRVAAYPDAVFEGEVLALNSSISPETRTVQVRARLDNPEGRLQPGMFANVTSFGIETRTVRTVPRTAISYNTYGDFVFAVVEGDSGPPVVERRTVRTGEVRDGQVELIEGVDAGVSVVRTGLLRLRNQQPVEIVDAEQSRGGGENSRDNGRDGAIGDDSREPR